jgi:hypothetical protein
MQPATSPDLHASAVKGRIMDIDVLTQAYARQVQELRDAYQKLDDAFHQIGEADRYLFRSPDSFVKELLEHPAYYWERFKPDPETSEEQHQARLRSLKDL